MTQILMAWTVEENTASLLDYLERAKELAADVVVFPECATTGYHRRIQESLIPDLIESALDRIRGRCAELNVAAIVGTPYFLDDRETVWNACVVIGPEGDILAACPKVDLTSSEATLFAPGDHKPTFRLGDRTCTALLCKEVGVTEPSVLDEQHRLRSRHVEVIFWPGINDMRDEDAAKLGHYCKVARTLGVYLVQANWPHDQFSLTPQPSFVRHTPLSVFGCSVAITPTGEVIGQGPADQPGITLVAIDELRARTDGRRSGEPSSPP